MSIPPLVKTNLRGGPPGYPQFHCASGFQATEIWPVSERWFARLHSGEKGLMKVLLTP